MSTRAGRRRGRAPVARAQLRSKAQITLPVEVRDALHIAEGDEVEFEVAEDGSVSVRGLTTIDADQRWFWTASWQEGERAASAEIAADELTVYDSVEDMFDAMEQ